MNFELANELPLECTSIQNKQSMNIGKAILQRLANNFKMQLNR